jgi:hypothetical protein
MYRPGNKFTSGRHQAKKKSLSWTIEKDQYVSLIKQPCDYCGGPLPKAGIGLDRLNNKKGYDIDNVIPCCSVCNLVRGNRFTYGEMKKFIGPAIKLVSKERGEPLHVDFTRGLKPIVAAKSPGHPIVYNT